MTRSGLVALTALLLAGCGGSEEPARNEAANVAAPAGESTPEPVATNAIAPADNASEAAGPFVNLAPDGLTLVLDTGAARQAGFGIERDMALRMVSAALGNAIEQGDNPDCGAGPLGFASFRGGLSLYFQEDKFVGWDLDGRDGGKFTTAAGVGIGSTRAQLESATVISVEDSSLGIEFRAGEMSGLLDAAGPEGKVTNLWAGTTCIAR